MTEKEDLYIVGVGTSAGGLEALERFFTMMPAHPKLAFLIVQHLSPDYKSHMVELLSKHTPLMVHEATDGCEIIAGHVYLLPPRNNMTVFNHKLYLVEYDRGHGLNLPIDIMLESLAKDQGSKAIACILSGTGSDGTRGIRAIKEYGGIVLAQDDTAKFDGMPRSAVATQLVDFIAPAESMPEIILRYVTHPHPINQDILQSKLVTEQDMIGKILAILRDHIGVDFTGYKPNTLVRRIERRMSLFEMDKLENYIRFLQQTDSERRTLFKEFLIGVTSFFRDQEAFEFVQTEVIPAIMAHRERGQQVRVWVAGCSTGEEAYSLAILFQDYMERSGRYVDIKIFATDIDREALEQAGQGVFAESVLADIPAALLHNYFIKRGEQYEVVRQIRSMVVFANHNLLKDPPFSRIDLISCRNLLIYMQSEIQSRILSTFQFSLNADGFLFLGSSESLGEKGADFIVENAKWKIYRFRGTHNPLGNLEMKTHESDLPSRFKTPAIPSKSSSDWRMNDQVLRGLVENVLPPCLVVDESLSVIHAFGEIDLFVRAPRGYQLNLNIMNMLREELTIPVSTALHRTFRDAEDMTFRQIQLADQNSQVLVNVTTRLFWEHGRNQRLAIILFAFETAEAQANSSETYTISDGVSQRIANLEQELQFTRENLQLTIEELETSNEELQATNEELMAANEELQSTNEELESVNEELLTVNNEYQAKIKELSALNDDINNLLKSIDIGTLFLDRNLKVRKFTPAAQQYINLLEQDIGRSVAHFAHRFVDFDLIEAIQKVLDSLISAEYEVQINTNHWLQIRIVPYRTYTDQINGVVLTMVDITDLKLAVSTAQNSSEYAQVILNSLSAHIAVVDHKGNIVSVNRAWQEFSKVNGGSPEHTDVGTNYLKICSSASGYNTEGARECYSGLRALLDGDIDEFDLEYPCHSPDKDRWFLLRAVSLNTGDGRIVISHIDITERKEIENALQHTNDRLELAMLAHPVALFEQDLTLQYVWIHNSGIAYPVETWVDQSDTSLLARDSAEHVIGIKRLAMKKKQQIHESVELTTNDGFNLNLNMIVKPIIDECDNVTGVIGVFYDPLD